MILFVFRLLFWTVFSSPVCWYYYDGAVYCCVALALLQHSLTLVAGLVFAGCVGVGLHLVLARLRLWLG